MESLPGEALANIVRVMNRCRTRLPKRVAARIVAEAAGVARDAHSLSAQTIILTTQGTVTLAGASVRGVTPPTDIVYALGAVLYEMLCGQPPGDPLVSVAAHLASQVRLNALTDRGPEVDAVIDGIVSKAMAPSPHDRHQTADELRRELDCYLDGIGGTPTSADLAKLLVNTFGARYVAKLESRGPVAAPSIAVMTPQAIPPAPVAAAYEVQSAPPKVAMPERTKRKTRPWLYALAASAAALAGLVRHIR